MAKTFPKSELARHLAQEMGWNITQTAKAVDRVFDLILEHAEAGERVSIGSFGSFTVKKRAARTARNPHTGAAVEVPARDVLAFKPFKIA